MDYITEHLIGSGILKDILERTTEQSFEATWNAKYLKFVTLHNTYFVTKGCIMTGGDTLETSHHYWQANRLAYNQIIATVENRWNKSIDEITFGTMDYKESRNNEVEPILTSVLQSFPNRSGSNYSKFYVGPDTKKWLIK